MKKKIIALVLAITVLFGAIVGGTLAYLADTDSAVNVATVGNVKVKQHQLKRAEDVSYKGTLEDGDLIPYEQGIKLYPAYAKADADQPYQAEMKDLLYWGPYVTANGAGNGLWNEDKLTGAIDSFVFVENTGKSDAYYRTWVALECPEGAEYSEGSDKDFMYNSNGHKLFDLNKLGYKTIGDQRYFVLVITYKAVLAPNEIARPSLLQVVMTENADNAVTEACGETYEILAFTEAVQVENMPDADTALDAAFGDPNAGYMPWAEDIKPSKTVYNAAELAAALNDGVEVVCLGADIAVDAALTLKADKVLAGNGYTLTNAAITVEDGARIENVKFEGAFGSAANVSVNKTSASVYKCTFAVNSNARAAQTYIGATLTGDNELVLKANTFYAGGIVDIKVDEPEAAPVVTVEDNVAIAESWAEANAIFCSDLIEEAITQVVNAAGEVVPAVSVWDGGTPDTSWYYENPDAEVFVLESAAQFAGLTEVAGKDDFAGQTIKLACDIDLNGKGNMVDSFTPIGSTGEKDSRGRLITQAFKGTLDGQGHTLSNLVQSGWDFGYEWGQYGSIGLFSELESATVKNIVLEGFNCQIEGGDISFIAGSATGDCTFENITINSGSIGTYNNGIGGIIGWSGAGTYNFKNITLGEDVVIGGLWGSFDSSAGGVVGQAEPGATYNFENVKVACRLDVYNDCTASYDYYNYRMCGMLIGRLEETITIDGANYPDTSKYNITCTNVEVIYGEWANYHYCRIEGQRAVRVEAGYAYGGIAADYDHNACAANDHHMNLIAFDQLFGGDQYAVKGLKTYEGVKVTYNNK